MKRYVVTSSKNEGVATVLTFRPAYPAARMEFRAGQYVALGFKRFGRRTPMRCFSLTNAPNAAGELQIAFRRQGKFTDALAALKANDELFVAGPFGSFCVPSNQEYPLVYLAAGIGITPFISLIRAQALKGPHVPTVLFYSCRSLDDVAFASELMQLARENSWLTVRFLASQVPGTFRPHPMVVPGRLTPEVLTEFSPEDADYYICGPRGYNDTALRMLEDDGIAPEQINIEAFGQGSKLGVAGFAVQKLVYSLVAVALLIGFAGVFALDSVKAREKLAANTTTTQPTTTTSSSNGSTATTNSSSSTDSTATTNQGTPAQQTQTYYYRQPMSSVS